MANLHDITLRGWAIPTTGQVAAWCPWCADLHMHGQRDAVVGDVLHRAAHCTSEHSPAFGGGYDVHIGAVADHVREVEPAPRAIEPGAVPLAERMVSGATFGGWGLRLPVLRAMFTNGRLSSDPNEGFTFTPRGLEVSMSPGGSWWVRQRQRSGWATLGHGGCVLSLMELLFAWPRGWAAVHILRAAGAVLSAETAARMAALLSDSSGDHRLPFVPSPPLSPDDEPVAPERPPRDATAAAITAAIEAGITGDDIRLLAAFAQHLGPVVKDFAAPLRATDVSVADLVVAFHRVADFIIDDRAEQIARLLDAAACQAERRNTVLDLAKARRSRRHRSGDNDGVPPTAA